jgi:hypothetical protein
MFETRECTVLVQYIRYSEIVLSRWMTSKGATRDKIQIDTQVIINNK